MDMNTARIKEILNAGSGPVRPGPPHPAFPTSEWREIRVDIDPCNAPDLVCSFSNMREVVADGRCDALWSSHSIEHLSDHEVLPTFKEFKRVLRDDGFAVVTCPNMTLIAKALIEEDIESVAYVSPAGPIRLLDIIYGHAKSIEAGKGFMAHRTGFTAERLGRVAAAAGFAEARVLEGDAFDLWAVLFMPGADRSEIRRQFSGTNISALVGGGDAASEKSGDMRAPRPKRIRLLRH